MKTLQPPSDSHFQKIYSGAETHLYDAMVGYEDAQGNLPRTLRRIVPMEGKNILDVGAGTGRVSRLLNPYAGKVLSVDLNFPMLKIAQRHQSAAVSPWFLTVGDALGLPIRGAWADVALAGWAFGHFSGWFDAWEGLVDRALDEMRRVLKPGGTQIIIETMGTGFAEPAPPAPWLAAYYERLEARHGFQKDVIRTDYAFPNVAAAVELAGFFFGAELAARLRDEDSKALIEWTGIWWRHV